MPLVTVLVNLRADEGNFAPGDLADLSQLTIDALPEGSVDVLDAPVAVAPVEESDGGKKGKK